MSETHPSFPVHKNSLRPRRPDESFRAVGKTKYMRGVEAEHASRVLSILRICGRVKCGVGRGLHRYLEGVLQRINGNKGSNGRNGSDWRNGRGATGD